MQETRVWSLGWEDRLVKRMAIHASILAWRISWTEEPGWLQSMGLQRVRHDWETNTHTCVIIITPRDSLIIRHVSVNQKSREYLGCWLGPGCAGRGEGGCDQRRLCAHLCVWLCLTLVFHFWLWTWIGLYPFPIHSGWFLCQRFKTALYFSVFNCEMLWYMIPLFSHEDSLRGRHVPWPLPNQEKLFGGWEMGRQVGL